MAQTNMKKEDYIKSLGFEEDPFRYFNADQEDRLDKYFVSPPYFESLWGDPKKPESHVILAPRGGGKSAQRRMIEERGWKEDVFIITYDQFFTTNLKSLEDADLSYHLRNLNKLALITYFSHLANWDYFSGGIFSADEKRFLTKMVDIYLGDVDMMTIKEVVHSSQTLPSKIKKWWNDNLPLVGVLSAVIKMKFGLDIGKPSKFEQLTINEDPLTHFRTILALTKRLNTESCYILIDKVDETELTGNDPSKSYEMIKALIKDLNFINSKDFSIKFFLWDALENHYAQDARQDRVQEFRLEWKYDELCNMIDRRLTAYSDGRITALNQIFEIDSIDINRIIISFSNNSPRNVIRILQDTMDEQVRLNTSKKVQLASLDLGIKKFCREQAKIHFGLEIIGQLKRISNVGFTTNYLSNDLYKSANTARRRIQIWEEKNAIKQVCSVPNKTGRPSPYYLIVDSSLIPVVMESSAVKDLVSQMAVQCAYCGRTYFLQIEHFDQETIPLCPNCDSHLL